jgi:tetratricopeptide (TPR) repeat protein
VLEPVRALCAEHFLPGLLPQIESRLGRAYSLVGRQPAAIALIEGAIERLSHTFLANLSVQVGWLAEAHLLAGRIEDAQARARQALEMAGRYQEPGNEAWILHVVGEIARRRDPPDVEASSTAYHRALTLAEASEMRPLGMAIPAKLRPGQWPRPGSTGARRSADESRRRGTRGCTATG